ncbi:hypothetical protein ACFQ1X_00945 [Metaplanococcus flavidus]|uniref:Uncharacterized protein n=1 Tax=Metaplanococcus flavidus TaxID=569883 RepID=A0ABW3L8P1_9BACL
MNLNKIHQRFFISDSRNTKEQPHSLKIGGYLGMPGICLSIFREKKTGTSVISKTSSSYSAFHSPPPIRPMVEKNPFYETPAVKYGVQNQIEECA